MCRRGSVLEKIATSPSGKTAEHSNPPPSPAQSQDFGSGVDYCALALPSSGECYQHTLNGQQSDCLIGLSFLSTPQYCSAPAALVPAPHPEPQAESRQQNLIMIRLEDV